MVGWMVVVDVDRPFATQILAAESNYIIVAGSFSTDDVQNKRF